MKRTDAGVIIDKLTIFIKVWILWLENPTGLNPSEPHKANADVESTIWYFSTSCMCVNTLSNQMWAPFPLALPLS